MFLTNTNPPHNKWYYATIAPLGDGEVVAFAYGPLGSCHKIDLKTPSPVSPYTARAILSDLLYSKMRRGYQDARRDPTFADIARGDPERVRRLLEKWLPDPGARPIIARLLAHATPDEVALVTPRTLLPLLADANRAIREAGMGAARLLSRTAPRT